jgi:hypothetical protein
MIWWRPIRPLARSCSFRIGDCSHRALSEFLGLPNFAVQRTGPRAARLRPLTAALASRQRVLSAAPQDARLRASVTGHEQDRKDRARDPGALP